MVAFGFDPDTVYSVIPDVGCNSHEPSVGYEHGKDLIDAALGNAGKFQTPPR